MQLNPKKFGHNKVSTMLADEVVMVDMYYYETKHQVHDVIKSPFSDRFMFRVDMGSWTYRPNPIHQAIIRYYELEGAMV